MISALLKRPNAQAAARSQPQNPMVSAMMRVAKKHPLNRGAILRGC
jgi:hypothetical protein